MDLLQQLDKYALDGDFPIWENALYTCGAMRVLGLNLQENKKVLVFEEVRYSRPMNMIESSLYYYGTDVERPGYAGCIKEIVPRDVFIEDITDHTLRLRITDIIFDRTKGENNIIVPPKGFIPEYFSLPFNNKELKLRVRLPSMGDVELKHPELLKRLLPPEIILFQLCESLPKEELFSSVEEIAEFLKLPGEIDTIFDLTNWEHPKYEQLPSSFPDLVSMVESLESGKSLGKLSESPNGNWRYWLDGTLLYTCVKQDEDNWPPSMTAELLLGP